MTDNAFHEARRNEAPTPSRTPVTDQNPTAPRPPSSSSTTAGEGVIPEFAPAPDGRQLRYAVVGTGHRAGMYIGAITGEHADVASLVALLDTNPGRMAHYEGVVSEALGGPAGLPQYAPDGLEKMIAEQSVDVVAFAVLILLAGAVTVPLWILDVPQPLAIAYTLLAFAIPAAHLLSNRELDRLEPARA